MSNYDLSKNPHIQLQKLKFSFKYTTNTSKSPNFFKPTNKNPPKFSKIKPTDQHDQQPKNWQTNFSGFPSDYYSLPNLSNCFVIEIATIESSSYHELLRDSSCYYAWIARTISIEASDLLHRSRTQWASSYCYYYYYYYFSSPWKKKKKDLEFGFFDFRWDDLAVGEKLVGGGEFLRKPIAGNAENEVGAGIRSPATVIFMWVDGGFIVVVFQIMGEGDSWAYSWAWNLRA